MALAPGKAHIRSDARRPASDVPFFLSSHRDRGLCFLLKERTMRTVSIFAFCVAALLLSLSCSRADANFQSQTIIDLERGALDRWGKGDPQGYIEIFADEITYFDPMQAKRIDGLEAMRAFLAPITGKVKVDRYEMIGPKVQRHGEVAVLTFNLVSHGRSPEGVARTMAWNSTETYALIDGKWKIIHSHWSFTKPELKQPAQP
jgi:ketosteroid isomerase-like protein